MFAFFSANKKRKTITAIAAAVIVVGGGYMLMPTDEAVETQWFLELLVVETVSDSITVIEGTEAAELEGLFAKNLRVVYNLKVVEDYDVVFDYPIGGGVVSAEVSYEGLTKSIEFKYAYEAYLSATTAEAYLNSDKNEFAIEKSQIQAEVQSSSAATSKLEVVDNTGVTNSTGVQIETKVEETSEELAEATLVTPAETVDTAGNSTSGGASMDNVQRPDVETSSPLTEDEEKEMSVVADYAQVDIAFTDGSETLSYSAVGENNGGVLSLVCVSQTEGMYNCIDVAGNTYQISVSFNGNTATFSGVVGTYITI